MHGISQGTEAGNREQGERSLTSSRRREEDLNASRGFGIDRKCRMTENYFRSNTEAFGRLEE